MTRNALNHSVARATGEPVSLIRQLGFVLVHPPGTRRSKRCRGASGDHATTKPTPNVTGTRSP